MTQKPPTAHKLTGQAKHLICQLLAEFESPSTIQDAVERRFGVRISRETVYHYRNHRRWRQVIEEKREALNAALDQLPIASRYWRMRQRQQVLEQARHQDKPDLSTARGLLTDAAREMGQLQPEDPATAQIGSINLTMVNQVLQLPENIQEEYLRTGRLPARAYLSDVG